MESSSNTVRGVAVVAMEFPATDATTSFLTPIRVLTKIRKRRRLGMPLTRYQIRNEYILADPELYKAADRDDPEALVERVAMAGLVGVLLQLSDLVEFVAEIFHDLYEEVMATSARGHGLMIRVQQLEAEFPSIEKAFLSQTNHAPFFSITG
ncbi:hypothetical protein LWI29_035444 [Acer saccharum]|uniref:Uncharacterized protein n=1 Tax=Acer saccharum TaxID=4024 RepID=A0AA39WAR0_ACESA|nr:hypothetical protein LWI29_035444 [Acer saccharum]